MLAGAIILCFVLGLVFAFVRKLRFLTAYLVFVPLMTMAGGLAAFMLLGIMGPPQNHMQQMEQTRQMFFAGTGFGFVAGCAFAWWLNSRTRRT